MTQKAVYRYKREDGGITHSTDKPEGVEYTELCLLIADEGKMLTKDGEALFCVVEVESADGWYEVDAPPEEEGVIIV